MPTSDERLKDKVEALLEEKIPAIEVKLAEVSIKQDQMLSKLDAMSSTLHEHVNLQTRQELRIAAIEVKSQVADASNDKKKDRRRSILIGAIGATISGSIGFFLKWLMGHLGF